MCFVWVKAHGGGVAPNAYADAIAKSHLAEAPRDVPLEGLLPRACIYAVATGSHNGESRRWAVAADRSLRQLMVEQLTARELARLRAVSKSSRASKDETNATAQDRRLLDAMLRANERVTGTGKLTDEAGEGDRARPTPTGRAMQLRADDLKVGENGACELCGERGVGGGHVLCCGELGPKARHAAGAVAAALWRAAEEGVAVETTIPMTTKAGEWMAGSRAAGEAVEALGVAPPDEALRRECNSAEEWAAEGWRREGERYTLSSAEGAPDLRKIAWCAVAVRSAGELAVRHATAAAASAGTAADAGRQAMGHTALRAAAQAIGNIGTNRETGEPEVEMREVTGDGGRPPLGVERVELEYAQLQPERKPTGAAETVAEWDGAQGAWLRAARTGASAQGTWSAHTRRGFCKGAGAAHRKEVVTVAVAPDETVYTVAQPGLWPWRLQYRVLVQCDGGRKVLARVRLQRDRDGEAAIEVSAWPAKRDGTPTRDAALAYQRVGLRAEEDAEIGRMRDLFWVYGWEGAPRMRPGAREALEAAAAAAEAGGLRWECVRRGLAGELPQQTRAERAEERKRREQRQQEAVEATERREEAGTRAGAAQDEARWAAERARRAMGGSAAGAPVQGGRRARDERREELRAAAELLGVEADAEPEVVRKHFLRAALRKHPDKGGNAAELRQVMEAYGRLRADTPEVRRCMANIERGEEPVHSGAATADVEPEVAAQAAQAAEARAADAVEAAQEAEARERAAREAATTPATWERVAAALTVGVEAYFAAWGEFQKRARGARDTAAREAGFESHRAARTAEAAQRTAQRRADTAAAAAQEMQALREAERRVMARITAARAEEAATLRALSGEQLRAALEADWVTVKAEYVVEVPWEMWCHTQCVCRKRAGCQHRGSKKYERYEIMEVVGSTAADAAPDQQMWVTLQRIAAPRPVQRPAKGTTWDVFEVEWRHIAGLEQYGESRKTMRIVPRGGEAEDESDAGELHEETQCAGVEHRQAARRARERVSKAMEAARRAADQEVCAQSELGAGAADADMREVAAEAAWRAEAVDKGAGEAEGAGERPALEEGAAERRGGDDGTATTTRQTEARTAATRRRRTGRHWWQGAWMGEVAAAELAAAWAGPPTWTNRGQETQRAQSTATRVGQAEAVALGRAAARGAAAEAMRRAGRLRMATDERAAAGAEGRAVRRVVEATEAWKARTRHDEARSGSTLGVVAGGAAQHLRKTRPAADAAAESERAGAVKGVAQVMAATAAATHEKVLAELELEGDACALVRANVRDAVAAILREQPGPCEGPTAQKRGGDATGGRRVAARREETTEGGASTGGAEGDGAATEQGHEAGPSDSTGAEREARGELSRDDDCTGGGKRRRPRGMRGGWQARMTPDQRKAHRRKLQQGD